MLEINFNDFNLVYIIPTYLIYIFSVWTNGLTYKRR